MKKVSAYIPAYNNEKSVLRTIESIKAQTHPVSELFVIDDGSTDRTAAIVELAGIGLIRNANNEGRGAVRAKAIELAQHPLVLCCDATNSLAPDFLEKSLRWFGNDSPTVAAVQGRMAQCYAQSPADRWRGRHLFKLESASKTPVRNSAHATGGCIVMKDIVLQLGNYNPLSRQGEDKELGIRLLAAGFEVIFDPDLVINATCSNNMIEVLERYARWHENDACRLSDYLRQISYSVKVMAAHDLRDRDLLCVPLSLLSPHYQFWRTWCRQNCPRKGS